MKKIIIKPVIIAFQIILMLLPTAAKAQYFGRNKPSYQTFKYQIKQTPHFEIHHYLTNDTVMKYFAGWTEEWYRLHQLIFKDTFKTRNPLILYANHADFQQTNAISSIISEGTGGVTESLKNRVILPFAPTLYQTDHVLGHELVHAFQYHKLLKPDSANHYNINNLPLWMVEGMAEYLSIGSVDANTSMWMRDALIQKKFPSINDLNNTSEYFPYRYGQALWAFIGKTWGDSIILPLFEKTAQYGLDGAIDSLFHFNEKTLSGMWKTAMENHYGKLMKDTTYKVIGKQIISKKNAGSTNVSPSLSPDGKYIAFFSEKNVFTLDLYLADAQNGKIIKKLSSVNRNQEIDDFSFIESGGTWSPDSKQFAFVVYSKGRQKLAIVDVRKAKMKLLEIKGLNSFSNPEWSPDGRYIVVTGLVNGIGDLYLYEVKSGKTEKLTHDLFSNIHPSWSSDGKKIVYSTEYLCGAGSKKFAFHINILDLETREIKTLDVFPKADNLNPRFSNNDQYIYFVSDADGFRNLYKYDLNTDKVFRLTQYMTGISGITTFSPAISTDRQNDLIAYTYYFNGNYEIYTASATEFNEEGVNGNQVNFDAATLPLLRHLSVNIVDSTLYNRPAVIALSVDSINNLPYRPKLKLDYISNSVGVGISTGPSYNTTDMAGSIYMIFSDMVGNHQIYSSLSLNGEIYDFGGQVAYLNQGRKIKWGASLSHIPYRSGNMFWTIDTLKINNTDYIFDNLVLDYIRMFEDNISLFSYYPLTQTRRFEGGISASWYSYRIDRYNNYYDALGYYVGGNRKKLPAPDGISFQTANIAYVEDDSYFGMTSPLQGHRARYQIERYFGNINLYNALIDYRRYFFNKPVGLAFRLYHNGLYGKSSQIELASPMYIGYPWLIRGYEQISVYGGADNVAGYSSLNVNNLVGTRMALVNAEVRIPFSGPKVLAPIKSNIFLTDLNLFLDGGLAWNKGDQIKFKWQPSNFNERIPVWSTGISMRINLFGYLVIEPYYAIPFQNGGFKNKVFGINFVPGW
jgi:Tol biopolymer transport system component